MIALAVAAYSGSFCAQQIGLPNKLRKLSRDGVVRISRNSPSKAWYKNQGYGMRFQTLQCLDNFIGGRVCVFGSTVSTPPAFLSISLRDFVDLWGSVRVRGNGPVMDQHQLTAIISLQGTITRVIHNSEIKIQQDEVAMTWRSTRPGEAYEMLWLERDALATFRVTDRMLIGHRPPRLAVTQTFQFNNKCRWDETEWERYLSSGRLRDWDITPSGVHGLEWNVDTRTAQVSLAQFGFGVTGNQTWKVTPAMTYKGKIVQETDSANGVLSYLKVLVGVRFSPCTNNALRVTLLQAIQLAYPGYATYYGDLSRRKEYQLRKKDREKLRSAITMLSWTGVNRENYLQCQWQYGSEPSVAIWEKPSAWTSLLKDDLRYASFVVITPGCFQYAGWDDHDKRPQWIESTCTWTEDHFLALQPGGLLTKFQLWNAPTGSETRSRLKLGAKFPIKEERGFLTVRNDDPEIQLVFYENGILDRAGSSIVGRNGTKVLESMNVANKDYIFDVFVRDLPPSALKRAAGRMRSKSRRR